jgi:hypothetical protein
LNNCALFKEFSTKRLLSVEDIVSEFEVHPILEYCELDKYGLLQGIGTICLKINGAPICAVLSLDVLKKSIESKEFLEILLLNKKPILLFLSGLCKKFAAPKLKPLLVEEKP